jgi:DNA gyrase subunit A
MKLRKKDEIVNAVKADENKKLIIISENGYGKRTNFKEFRLQNRGGIGIKCVKDIKKIGNIICGMAVSDDDDIIAFTQKGKAIRTPINSINILKRVTQGVITLRLDNDDLAIKAIVVKEKLDIKEEGEE